MHTVRDSVPESDSPTNLLPVRHQIEGSKEKLGRGIHSLLTNTSRVTANCALINNGLIDKVLDFILQTGIAGHFLRHNCVNHIFFWIHTENCGGRSAPAEAAH